MTQRRNSFARKLLAATATVSLSLGLGGCFNNSDDNNNVAVTPMPTPTPTPKGLDVSQCLNQEVAPGVTVANLAVPDVLNIDPAAPAGFPNGRLLSDPVIDVTLAVLLLDISAPGQSPATFAGLPLNPPANDVAFRSNFPFLAPPQGSPPIGSNPGMTFNFRTDSATAYTRVDRMAFPALSTALIPSDTKIAYNDANPLVDSNGEFVDEISSGFGPRDFEAAAAKADLTVSIRESRAADAVQQWLPMELHALALIERFQLLGDHDDIAAAKRLFDNGLTLAPEPAGPALSRASLALTMHDLETAESALVRFDKAVTKPARGDVTEAERLYSRSDMLTATLGSKLRLANQALWSGDLESARAFAEAGWRSVSLDLARAEVIDELKRGKEAEKYRQRAIAINPNALGEERKLLRFDHY